MPIEVATLTDDQLSNLINNHRAKSATTAPLYLEAVAEQQKRHTAGLDIEATVRVLTTAARQRRFISYKEVAGASGAKFNKVRFRINRHLDDVLEYCHRNGMPFLTAIVVPIPNLETGKQKPETLKGFVAGVQRLGVSVINEDDYMEKEQQRVFDWARAQIEPGPA